MAGRASPLTFSQGKDFGTHRCKTFDMEVEADCTEYSELRTKANDAGSGITIEKIKEIVKTESGFTMKDGEQVDYKKDRYLLFVEWWEKKTKAKGDADEPPEWSREKPVAAPVVPDPAPGGDGRN